MQILGVSSDFAEIRADILRIRDQLQTSKNLFPIGKKKGQKAKYQRF